VTDGRWCRVQEFTNLAGVTVRTLRHYDGAGLLRAQRDQKGFRVYTSADLERLQRIIGLKFIGLPLKQIRAVLSGDKRDLRSVLCSQIAALEEKKRRLEITISAVRSAEALLRSGGQPCLKTIIEAMEMERDYQWIFEHFNEEKRPSVEDQLKSRTQETWRQLQREWNELARAMQAAEDTNAASAESQELLRRWEDLIRRTTGEDQDLVHGLKSLYADRDNWPEHFRRAVTPLLDGRSPAFVKAAAAARER